MANITHPLPSRPRLLSSLLGLAVLCGPALVHADAKCQTSDAGHLIVADVQAESIYAYRLPNLELTGQLDGVVLGTHAGTLTLPDGRVVFADEKAGAIVALKLDEHGAPHIVQSASVNLGDGAAWATSDRDFTQLVVSVDIADSETKAVHVIDLATFASTSLDVHPATEEVHPFLAGDWLVLGVGGQAQALRLDEVLAGKAPAATTLVPIGAGSHGPVISHDLQRGYISTELGLDGFEYKSGELTPLETIIPWNAGTETTGQNYRPRLSWDGVYVYGAITSATPEAAESWAQRGVDVHVADLLNESAKRIALASGIVTRFQLSRSYALFANLSGSGDFAYLFDVSRGSPTFQSVVAQIPLEPLSAGPVVGEDPADKQTRSSAITPDGHYAFVSHGGDGLISVIDTTERKVVSKIETPTELLAGGYLVAIQQGVVSTDTGAR